MCVPLMAFTGMRHDCDTLLHWRTGVVSNTGIVKECDSTDEKKCNHMTLGTMKQVML